MALSACCSSRQPRLQETGLQWEVVPRCNLIFNQSIHNVMWSASPISLWSREAHLLENRSRARPDDASHKIPLRCAAMATHGNGAQCCGHAREREFCYEQRLARTRILVHAHWTTMQWTTWFSYLGCRPTAGATATSLRCVMRAPRPGQVVFQTVRLHESSVVSLGRSLMSWPSSGSEYVVENEARREAWRSSSNTTADWPWSLQPGSGVREPKTGVPLCWASSHAIRWNTREELGGVEAEACGDCGFTFGPAIVRQVAHAQGCTPGHSWRASERLIPSFFDIRLVGRRVSRRLTLDNAVTTPRRSFASVFTIWVYAPHGPCVGPTLSSCFWATCKISSSRALLASISTVTWEGGRCQPG